MAVAKKTEPRKLKVGSQIKVDLVCEITGKTFQVGVEVMQPMDTDVLFKFKARKWYEGQTAEEKQAIANMLNG